MPAWSDLNQLGQNSLLRSSYIWLVVVPILARLFEHVPTEIIIPVGGADIPVSLGLPFSWYVLFFTAVAVSVGNIIYSICCPGFIKRYNTFTAFKNDGKGDEQLLVAVRNVVGSPKPRRSFQQEFFNLYTENESIKHAFQSLFEDKKFDEPKDTHVEGRMDASLSGGYIELTAGKSADAFWSLHRYLDKVRQLYRFLCAVFYSVGFVLLIWLALQNVLFVIRTAGS